MHRWLRPVASVVLLAVVAVLAWLTAPSVVLAPLAWLADDPLRFGIACVLLAAVRPLLAWPTTLLAVAVGYGYGPPGAPFALALVVLTSVPPYVLARSARGGRVGAAGRRVVDVTGDLRGVIASRLLPAPSDVASAGAGVAGVPLGAFLLGTAAGEIPWVVAGVLVGDSLGALASGSLTGVFDARVVGAAAIAAVLLLAGPAYRHIASGGVE